MFSKNGKKKPIKREFSAGGAVFRRKVSPFDFAQGKQVSPAFAKACATAKALGGTRSAGRQVSNVEWLLIRQKGSKKWRLPKGNIERGERAEEAAVREVKEETGVLAKTLERIDTIQYFYFLGGTRIFKRVTFFLMEYIGGNPRIDSRWAHEIEKVGWLEIREAITRLAFPSEKKVLGKAAGILNIESRT